MHVVGNFIMVQYIIVMISIGTYWWLIAAPLTVYPFAWTGHFIFEKNKPAGFKSPFKAKIADWIMCYRLIFGYPIYWGSHNK